MTALGRLFTTALVIGIGATAVTFLIALAAFLQWFKQFNVRPDFHTNGLLWYSTTALTFDAVVFPIILRRYAYSCGIHLHPPQQFPS